MRKRYSAAVFAVVAAIPVVMTNHPVSAASAHNCVGNHTWNLPNNSLGPIFSATMSEGWDRTCDNIDTSAGPFGLLTVNHDVAAPTATSTFSGDCAFGFSNGVDGGIRFFVGAVAVGAGVQGTAAATSVGVLGVPSVTPCTGGTITWNGVEDFTYTP